MYHWLNANGKELGGRVGDGQAKWKKHDLNGFAVQEFVCFVAGSAIGDDEYPVWPDNRAPTPASLATRATT